MHTGQPITTSQLLHEGMTRFSLPGVRVLTQPRQICTVPMSMEQADIDSGAVSLKEIVDHGEQLFAAITGVELGSGRPETTGGGDKRAVPEFSEDGEDSQ